MPKITAIEVQKKNDKRVNLFVDDKFLLSMDSSLVYKYRLKVGEEIDKDKLTDICKADDYEKAKNKALNSLGRGQKSEKKMREKLQDEYAPEIIDMVIDFLKKYSFIDDERFADRIVENEQKFKKLGKHRIKQNLMMKGIGKSDIETALSGLDEEIEIENVVYLARKKMSKIKETDKNVIKKKLFQHLLYKGFDYDIILIAIDKVIGESEK